MVLWHVAAVTFLFRWIFRDPKVDMRFLVAGALLPDVVDMAAATALGAPRAELWAHSLVMPSLVTIGVLLTTRRGRRRRAWMAMVVAWLFHLLIDGMWADASIFLWPAFGFDIVGSGAGFWPGAIERAGSDLWRWALEVVGGVYLVWLWRATGLSDKGPRRQLWATGRIPALRPPS